MNQNWKSFFGILVSLSLFATACGVKGPPLPPVADTPEASDREESAANIQRPAPVASPLPKTTSQTKSTH